MVARYKMRKKVSYCKGGGEQYMNDGYLFLIGCWILMILISTHWLDFMWSKINEKECAKVQSKRRLLLFIVMLLMVGQGLYVSIAENILINVSVLLLTMVFFYLIIQHNSEYQLQMVAVIIFLTVLYSVSHQLFMIDPIVMIFSPQVMLAVSFTFFLLLATPCWKQQSIMMLGGFIFGEVMHKYYIYKYALGIYIGHEAFRDQLTIGFMSLATVHLTVAVAKRARHYLKYGRIQSKQEG